MTRFRRTKRDAEAGLRDAVEVAVVNLEDERLHPTSRVRIALGVLRTALLRHPRRDPSARTRSTDRQ